MNALTSTAVMARRCEPAHSLDYFPTPPWATRALFEQMIVTHDNWCPGLLVRDYGQSIWDPASGEGHMALVFEEYFDPVSGVVTSDIFDYGMQDFISDYLHPDTALPSTLLAGNNCIDWIVTNPPFNVALEFIHKATKQARKGVAMLVRTSFLETVGRYDDLFSVNPPDIVAQFVERVPMHRGRWVVDGKTATSYCWLVWKCGPFKEKTDPKIRWIKPCRRSLTKHDDWLRFGGVVDVPAKHKAMLMLQSLEADLILDPDRNHPLQKILALRGQTL